MNYAVILAGGVGSRFWPFSRELEPKQLMKIVGEESLLQSTVQRLKGVIDNNHIYIVTNQIYFSEVKSQVSRFKIPEKNIILEPQGKNSAPSIGLCAKVISQFDKDACLLILPSDHYIKNLSNFRETVRKAIRVANENFLVTIGIKPSAPSTGYGYIKVSGKQKGYLKVDKFFEKPKLKDAKKFIRNRSFFWNSGIFIWKAEVILKEIKTYLPDLSKNLDLIKSVKDIPAVWPKIKPISIDYGIMEKSKMIAMIPGKFYWADLGSWDALGGLFSKDGKGNVHNGNAICMDSQSVFVFSRGQRLVSTIGLKNIIIADTPDALLICDKNRTQEVKKLVEKLKLFRRKEHKIHLLPAKK